MLCSFDGLGEASNRKPCGEVLVSDESAAARESDAVACFCIRSSVSGKPQQPWFEAWVGNDRINGSRRLTFPQNLIKLLMLININDENRLVEIAASFRLEVLGEYSRRIFADRFDGSSHLRV